MLARMDFSIENLKKPKTIVLIIGLILMVINISLSIFITEGSSIEQILNIFFVIGFNFLMLLWCSYDSTERGEKISSKFVLMMVLFGIFTLIYYLFRTRGFSSGLISVGKLLLLFIVSIVVSLVIYVFLFMIFVD